MAIGKMRAWCARAKYPGDFEQFLFGTVFAEGELNAQALLQQKWKTICPHEIEWLAILPGQLVFVEDKE